ncbi:unnamed protein product (macronuclear) [Paramecium tetraurelia]|uniref:Uncharacterized protein n=1 Tax=Paramecium tetraurelia TaxID=5888 RepID=A0CHB9_PARTE|nr:uncharacterized protein GSPATT00038288001 [Paramecium tetraurelia]CAK70186.1 unnamed protein product [Paramecium tetraurelia]|eukprot:XP_001437583.1 hypothetical protein (macronuclear) [Paramecium tetraurelia strain d4-2]
MKIIIVFIVLITIAVAQSQQGFDEIKSWRERIQFKQDYEKLQEMIQQVDHIIAYLDTEQGKNLTPKQYEELLNEITVIEQEIKVITSAYKEDDL